MQSFREHCRSLDESFDKPYPWTTSRVGFTDFHATFVAPATPTPLSTGKAPINRYSVDFVKRMDQRVFVDGEDTHPWEFTFELTQGEDNPAKWSAEAHPQYGITQTGHAFTVFATVIAVMKAFIAHHHPGIIYFSAHESDATPRLDVSPPLDRRRQLRHCQAVHLPEDNSEHDRLRRLTWRRRSEEPYTLFKLCIET